MRTPTWRSLQAPAAKRTRTPQRQLRSRRQQHSGVLHPGRDQVSRPYPCGEDGVGSRLSAGGVGEAAAIDSLRDAFGHLKAIGHVAAAAPVFERAAVALDADAGVTALEKSPQKFIAAAKQHRIWEREPTLRSPG